MAVKGILLALVYIGTLGLGVSLPAAAGSITSADLRFLTDDALKQRGSWGTGTKDAAKEAHAVLQLAIDRLVAASAGGDMDYFTGAGTQYMQREWPLFKAQAIAAVFDVQEHDAGNARIASYRACQEASEAFSDLYQTYRSAFLGGDGDLQTDFRGKVVPLIRRVEITQAACKSAL